MQGHQQLSVKKSTTAWIIGQGSQGLDHRKIALKMAVARFQTPNRENKAGIDAKLFANLRQDFLTALVFLPAKLNACLIDPGSAVFQITQTFFRLGFIEPQNTAAGGMHLRKCTVENLRL